MLNWDKFEKGFKDYHKEDKTYLKELKKTYFSDKTHKKNKIYTNEFEDFNITKCGNEQVVVRRMKVPTGWLVQTLWVEWTEVDQEVINGVEVSFISDPTYSWKKL